MYTVFSRLRAPSLRAKMRVWFEMWFAWAPKSSRMQPAPRAQSELPNDHSTAKPARMLPIAMALMRRSPPPFRALSHDRRSDRADQADGSVCSCRARSVVPRERVQMQGERRPERAERRERQRTERRVKAKHGFAAKQLAKRTEQHAVSHRGMRLRARELDPERNGERDHHPSGDEVHRAPPDRRADETGERAREQ